MKKDSNQYSKKYSEQYVTNDFETILIEIRRKKVLETINKYPHKNILEVGCGLEPIFPFVPDFEFFTIIEPSEHFVHNAKKLSLNSSNIHVIKGRLEDLSDELTSRNYDIIIISSLLHEVPDPDAFLQSVYKLCTRETVAHINMPNIYSFHRLLGLEVGLINNLDENSEPDIAFERKNHFDKNSLIKIVENNGFEVFNFCTYFIKPFSNTQMGALLKNKILEPSIVQGLENMIKYMPDMGCEMLVEVRKK